MAFVLLFTACSGENVSLPESGEIPVSEAAPAPVEEGMAEASPTEAPAATDTPTPTSTPTPEPTATNAPETIGDVTVTDAGYTVKTTSDLNMRKGPGTDYDKVIAVVNGTTLKVTGECSNGWLRVEKDGQTLFVSGKYTVKTGEVETPKATSTPIPTATDVPKATEVPKATNTPIPTATEAPKATSTPIPTATEAPKATSTPIPTATEAPKATSTPTPKPTATNTPTPKPTATNSPTPKPVTSEPDRGVDIEALRNVRPGDCVTFGAYEQDNNLSNGKEPIEWIVLDNEGYRVLVLSKYGLDTMPFSVEYDVSNWMNSYVRKWLNKDFYNTAFSRSEQNKIKTTKVYSGFYYYGADELIRETMDKMFLLSPEEFDRYSSLPELAEAFICLPTEYDRAKGALYDQREGSIGQCYWMLRPMADGSYTIPCIIPEYLLYMLDDIYLVYDSGGASVRPAMWIELTPGVEPTATPTPTSTPVPVADPVDITDMRNAEVGDYIVFGSYEQDNVMSNGKEPIEWRVLDRSGNSLLIISRFALEGKQYNEERENNMTWEKCDLRKWLNSDFINAAFTSAEQKKIKTTYVSDVIMPKNNIDPGNPTNDKVFLLSILETEQYFKGPDDRWNDRSTDKMCAPTVYAVEHGADKSGLADNKKDGVYTGGWWLRSPGNYDRGVSIVGADGSVGKGNGDFADWINNVRPAMWIEIDD